MTGCSSCSRPVPPVDVVRDVLDLAAVVLAGGSSEEYRHRLALVLRTPAASVAALVTVLQTVARPGALEDVRLMGLLRALRELEGGR